MDLLINYGLFLTKLITLIIIIGILFLFVNIANRKRNRIGNLRITNLNDHFQYIKNQCQLAKLHSNVQKKEFLKKFRIEKKRLEKQAKIKTKKGAINVTKPTMYIIDFKGDINARAVSSLREEISAILSVATLNDQVLLRLESQGGVIHGYGLAASQLQRLRDNKIYLIIVIDKVAASGGYMMACVANHIVAAPFSIIGSIGVVAQIPNFNKVLKKNNIDLELHTAGQFKRTLTIFGENTQEARNKFCQKLNSTHSLFKDFIIQMRPDLNIEKVANGDYWFGTQAINKKLVDSINTSDAIIMQNMDKFNLLNIKYQFPKRKIEYFFNSITSLIEKKLCKLFNNNQPLI